MEDTDLLRIIFTGIVGGFIIYLYWLLRVAQTETKKFRDDTATRLNDLDKRQSILEHDMDFRKNSLKEVYRNLDMLHNKHHELQLNVAKMPKRKSDNE